MGSVGDMSALPDTFRKRRLALALSQETAAQRARVTRKTVSDFENGRTSISLVNLIRLMAAVGLELTTRETSARPTLDELSERYSGLEDEAGPRKRAPRTRR